MRIVVNDIAASTGGALSVLKDFYNAVKQYDSDNEWIFLLGDNYLEETSNIKVITLPEIKNSHFKKLWFDFFSGKKFVKNLNPDVVLSLQNIITFGLKVPQAVYIHQSIPFQNSKKFSFLKSKERGLAVIQYLIGAIIKFSAKKAQKVMVQTNWMKKAVFEGAKVKDSKIEVVMPNINIDPIDCDEDFVANQFFYPTSNILYKNNDCIVNACNLLYEKGVKDFKVEMTVDMPLHPAIDSIGYIHRIEVLKKYKTSVLVFPSYIESCPFPLIEARSLNAMILVSDCPFAREILNDYENAYFFNAFKPEELAQLMEKVMSGEIELKSADEFVRTQEDSWKKVIDCLYKM